MSQEIGKQIIDKHFKGKGYKTISEQLDVPVTTVAQIIQKMKVHGIVTNLPGRGHKRQILRLVTKEARTTRSPLLETNHKEEQTVTLDSSGVSSMNLIFLLLKICGRS